MRVRNAEALANAGYSARHRGLAYRWHVDVPLLLLVMALALFGLVVLYSAAGGSTAVVFRQGARFGIGLLAMLVIAQIPPERLRRWSPVLFGVGLALLVTVLWIGHVGKGAQRWINLGFMRF